MALESPVTCVCYLNKEGDILAGIGDKLIVIHAKVYIEYRQFREQLAILRDAHTYHLEQVRASADWSIVRIYPRFLCVIGPS
eukprot:1186019-Prorocentrum_minimum.AAC.3